MDDRKVITKELIGIISNSRIIQHMNIIPEDIRIGVFYTGVVLNTGHAGMSYTPVQELPEAVCCPRLHAKMPRAGELLNLQITELMNYALEDNVLKAAVGFATINALSAILFDDKSCKYKTSAYGNALDLLKIAEKDTVVMIGAFPPFINRIREVTQRLFVIERNPRAAGRNDTFEIEPEDRLQELVPEADIMIITGVTLVNHTLEYILKLKRKAKEIVVVGPTASMYPEPLFKRGVTVLGGVRITDPKKMIHLIGEAGSGYDFFETCAKKFVIRSAV